MSDCDLTYLSYGGGVQSTALLIMSALGERGIPKADVAIFADTQGEIALTYAHIERMKAWAADHGIRLIVTTRGSLESDVLVGVGNSQVSIPAFIKVRAEVPCPCTKNDEYEDGEGNLVPGRPDPACVACRGSGKTLVHGRGVMRRLCTYDYKLLAIHAEVRQQLGLAKGAKAKGVKKARAMLGISYDEIIRMKPSREEWIENTFPLVDARLTRGHCKEIIAAHGIEVPPRSSCYFCPYHRNDYWRWLKTTQPDEFAKAVAFDEKIRHSQPKLEGEAYLHDSLVPLAGIDFKPDPQMKLDGFGNECEGMCGV